MKKVLNLVEILKNCPPETILYSTIHGDVKLDLISNNTNDKYSIYCTIIDKDTVVSFTKEGKYNTKCNGECVLFPSKENRDWSTFKIEPKFDINSLQPFDKVLGRYDDNNRWTCDFYEYYDKGTKSASCVVEVYDQCIPYNDETKHLVGTKNDCPKFYKWWE